MPNTRHDPLRDYLFKAILTLETVEDCYNFFDDLCTIKEITEMAKSCGGSRRGGSTAPK